MIAGRSRVIVLTSLMLAALNGNLIVLAPSLVHNSMRILRRSVSLLVQKTMKINGGYLRALGGADDAHHSISLVGGTR